MKKFGIYFLSLITLLSYIIPFIPSNAFAMASNFTYAYIDATDLSVRSCKNTDTKECPRLVDKEGETIWLNRPRVVEVINYDNTWARIRFKHWGYVYEGYVYTSYLGNKKKVNLDQNYANDLRRTGFPESYIEDLCKMHAIHPSWKFTPSKTNISLEDAVNGEINPISKNLIHTSDNKMLSNDNSAIGSNGQPIAFEPGWYAPSRYAIQYYLDPRNFLDDNSIFMFEQLSYSNNISENDIQKMLNGTFLSGTFRYNNQNYTYARAFLEAGKNNNVNPISLVSRVLQEQGPRGSATSDMNYNGKTYHNYFNFFASGNTSSEIIKNALTYAVARGWDNPYTAINGGAKELSNGYISNNQDTLYYQKFNIVGESRFWHQYMANIQAPYSESRSTFNSYWENNLVDNAFVFKIPVYQDMAVSSPLPIKSTNNNLASLSLTNVNLNPSFNSSITQYSAVVENNISNTTINLSLADNKANASYNKNNNLNVGDNNISIKVTAEDGEIKIYNIKITRKNINKTDNNQTNTNTNNQTNTNTNNQTKPSNTPSVSSILNKSGLKINNNNILTGINIRTNLNNFKNNIKKYTNLNIKILSTNGKEENSGIIKTGDRLVIGNSTYNLVVRGDTNGDGKVSARDYSVIIGHILGNSNLQGAYFEAADVNKDGKISAKDYSLIICQILGTKNITQ